MAVIVVTGGGSQAIADLLAVPGASRTVLEAIVPYSDAALSEFLGSEPAQAASEDTARALAERAAARARELRPEGPSVGIACTAALVTDRPKRGDHRAFVACGDEVRSVTLDKGRPESQGRRAHRRRPRARGARCRLQRGLTRGDRPADPWRLAPRPGDR